MRTVWIAVAVYAVVYALTAVLSGDSAVMVAGLLIGLVILVPVTFVALRSRRAPGGPGSRLGERG